MGGRGSSSSSKISRDVESYRILVGDKNIQQLRSHGATDKDIAQVYETYRQNRLSGMGRRAARTAAEQEIGSRNPTRKPITKRSNITAANNIPKDFTESMLSQGWSPEDVPKLWEDTQTMRRLMRNSKSKPAREITSTTYINSQRRLQRDVDNWFGRGM